MPIDQTHASFPGGGMASQKSTATRTTTMSTITNAYMKARSSSSTTSRAWSITRTSA